jgi:hypothetical protein
MVGTLSFFTIGERKFAHGLPLASFLAPRHSPLVVSRHGLLILAQSQE